MKELLKPGAIVAGIPENNRMGIVLSNEAWLHLAKEWNTACFNMFDPKKHQGVFLIGLGTSQLIYAWISREEGGYTFISDGDLEEISVLTRILKAKALSCFYSEDRIVNEVCTELLEVDLDIFQGFLKGEPISEINSSYENQLLNIFYEGIPLSASPEQGREHHNSTLPPRENCLDDKVKVSL